MPRKIVVLCGSPRKKGNTNRVVSWFAEGAGEAGASVEIVDTARLKYRRSAERVGAEVEIDVQVGDPGVLYAHRLAI